jgi:copper transport protein
LRFYLLVSFGVMLTIALSLQREIAARSTARPEKKVRGRAATARPVVHPIVRRLVLAGVVLSTVALLVTWSLAGHAAGGMQPPLAVSADLLHLFAMALWLGGLAMLNVSLRAADRVADLAAVLPRFSQVAFSCVVVLVLSGSYQAWREDGSIAALTGTTFGKLLLVKIAGVIVLWRASV